MSNHQLDVSIEDSIEKSSWFYVNAFPQVSVHVDNDSFSPSVDNDGPYMPSSVFGDHIEVFWQLYDVYYPGTIASIDSDGTHVVNGDDGET